MLISCSSYKGDLFERVAETEKDSSSEYDDSDYWDDDPDNAETEDQQSFYEVEDTSLNIDSDPDGADVYIDGIYYGSTPLEVTSLDYGRYSIKIEMQGFYVLTTWIDYDENRRFFDFSLEQITGYIDIQIWPENAQIMLGENKIFIGVTEVPVGNYKLLAQAFGYRDYETSVTISENMTTSLQIELEEVDFEITNFKVDREKFNPRNPGVLGTSTVYFEVSTYGRGEAKIINQEGIEVCSYRFKRFVTWNQSFIWTGRDNQDIPLNDGKYEIILTTVAEKTGKVLTVTADIEIDSSLTISFRSLFSGSAGLLYAPSTEVLPPFNIQCSVILLAHVHPYNDNDYFRAPVALGLRLGLPANSEINLIANMILENLSDNTLFGFSLSYKLQLLNAKRSGGIGSAVIAKLSYQHDYNLDSYANFTGASLGLPLRLNLGYFSLIISPEIIVSFSRVSYNPNEQVAEDFYSWLYGRAGLFFDSGYIMTGISASVRTIPFSEGLSLDVPFQAGFEFHAMLPETPIYLSLIIGAEIEDLSNYYYMGGFGLGVLW